MFSTFLLFLFSMPGPAFQTGYYFKIWNFYTAFQNLDVGYSPKWPVSQKIFAIPKKL